MSHVRLHRLFREEETMADLPIHETLRDQLEHFDLPSGRLLLELLERSRERNDLPGARRRASLGDGLEASGMVHVPGQDLFSLSSVHDSRIGLLWRTFTPPFEGGRLYGFRGVFLGAPLRVLVVEMALDLDAVDREVSRLYRFVELDGRAALNRTDLAHAVPDPCIRLLRLHP